MSAIQLLSSSASVGSTRCFQARRSQGLRHAGRVVSTSAFKQEQPSRREAVGALAAAVALLSATPAQAFLGIGEKSEVDTYLEETRQVLDRVQAFLDLPKDAENREEFVKSLRVETNSWVAKYRRRNSISGRPSFGNTYTVMNTLSGHFNSFGNTAPLPKKRLERVTKELSDANRLLARGR